MNEPRVSNWNIANQVTAARLFVTLMLLVTLQGQHYEWSLVLFLLGATTDWLDGYLARRYQLVTQLGRVIDPLADKLIICGSYIYLSAWPASGIPPWMTVVVVCRELIVTVLRSFLEQHGQDFSAKMPGKIKMVLQCAAVVASLVLLSAVARESVPTWLPMTVTVIAWTMVLSTLYSGLLYLASALRLIRELE